jgi:hypothetical protein
MTSAAAIAAAGITLWASGNAGTQATLTDTPFVQEFSEHPTLAEEAGASDVASVAVESSGTAWAAARAGLYRLEPGAAQWARAGEAGAGTGPVFDVVPNPAGGVWAGAWNGLYRARRNVLEKIEGIDAPLAALCRDGDAGARRRPRRSLACRPRRRNSRATPRVSRSARSLLGAGRQRQPPPLDRDRPRPLRNPARKIQREAHPPPGPRWAPERRRSRRGARPGRRALGSGPRRCRDPRGGARTGPSRLHAAFDGRALRRAGAGRKDVGRHGGGCRTIRRAALLGPALEALAPRRSRPPNCIRPGWIRVGRDGRRSECRPRSETHARPEGRALSRGLHGPPRSGPWPRREVSSPRPRRPDDVGAAGR